MTDRIKDILAKYGESMEGNTWKVQGQTVILHKALERIAAKAAIEFDPPQMIRAEVDEAVLLVTGSRPGGVKEWSIGEAKIGSNYRVSGKQAAYPYAMAEKRGKDRVILKLIELHGYAYSEDEADDFRDGKPRLVEPEPEPEIETEPVTEMEARLREIDESMPSARKPRLDEPEDWAPIQVISGTGENRKSAYQARKDGRWEPMVASLRACSTMDELKVWYAENSADIEELPAGWVKHLREECGLWRQLVEALRACPDVASLIVWHDLHAEEINALPAGWVADLREEWKDRAREIKSGERCYD
jgi:hypothetical protein